MKDAEADPAPARIRVVEATPASAKLLTDLLGSQRRDARAVASGPAALAAYHAAMGRLVLEPEQQARIRWGGTRTYIPRRGANTAAHGINRTSEGSG